MLHFWSSKGMQTYQSSQTCSSSFSHLFLGSGSDIFRTQPDCPKTKVLLCPCSDAVSFFFSSSHHWNCLLMLKNFCLDDRDPYSEMETIFFQRNLISNWKLRHKAPPFLIVPKIDGVKKLHFHHCPDPASPVTSIVVSQFTSSTTEYQLSFNSRCFLTLTFIRILLLLHCEVWLEMPQSALDTFFLSILFPSTCTFMLEQHQG